MESQERQLVLDQLNASAARLEGLVNGLSQEEWHFHETPERWSIAQTMEHVMAVETRITRAIEKLISEPREGDRHDTSALEPRIAGLTRATKFTAPPQVQPAGRYAETTELMNAFHVMRAKTTEFASETNADLRDRFIPHMAFGMMDCYQWLVLLGKHSFRHAEQIEEIKAHPDFPKQAASAAV
jgi:hypothetical protein